MSDLVVTERAGNVLLVTLNRPEARNALNPALMDGLSAALRDADADPEVRAIVLTGAGPVFCAGLDLKAFAANRDGDGFDGLTWFFREGVATPVTAARAYEIGLVNRVVPADRVRDEALALAARIAANGPLAVAMTKRLMRERRWATPEETESVFRSADAMEGAMAFAERRPPGWTGR